MMYYQYWPIFHLMFPFLATFATQGLSTHVEGNKIVLTCTFMEHFLTSGCLIELTHTTSGKQVMTSIDKNVAPSATVYLPQNGLYEVSVYDIDVKGEVVPAEAFTTTIWVGSDTIQATSPGPTENSPLPSSTVNPNTNQWEICEQCLLYTYIHQTLYT